MSQFSLLSDILYRSSALFQKDLSYCLIFHILHQSKRFDCEVIIIFYKTKKRDVLLCHLY